MNKSITITELNGHFGSADGINKEWLNETLILNLMNTERLYNGILNTRRKPESIAWETLMYTTNQILKDAYNGKYDAGSEHLKSWLNTEGHGYETIKPLVDYIKAEREEYKEVKRLLKEGAKEEAKKSFYND